MSERAIIQWAADLGCDDSSGLGSARWLAGVFTFEGSPDWERTLHHTPKAKAGIRAASILLLRSVGVDVSAREVTALAKIDGISEVLLRKSMDYAGTVDLVQRISRRLPSVRS